jgi:hypothetical protein
MFSGSRPDTIHGPYCHIFRDTINLVPGGVATACFKVTDAGQVEKKGAVVGALDRGSGRFEVDHGRVRELRELVGTVPARCADCFNRYHCVRECPDLCPLDGDDGASDPGFRCLMAKALTYATLRETAEKLWAEGVKDGVRGTEILRAGLPVGPSGG